MLSHAIAKLVSANIDKVLLRPDNFKRVNQFLWKYTTSEQRRYNKIYYRGVVFVKK